MPTATTNTELASKGKLGRRQATGIRRPSLRRVAAGKRNRTRRGPLSEAGRARLRAAARRHRPWQYSTGPRTAPGKAQARANGKRRQLGPWSVREARAEVRQILALLQALRSV